MRIAWLYPSLIVLACLASLAGCGEDDSPAAPDDPDTSDAPEPLAYFDVASGVGGRVVTDAATLAVYVGPDGADFALFEVTLTGEDAGTTMSLGPDDSAGFDEAVALLTNGVNDEVALWRTVVGGSTAITGSFEEVAFSGGALDGQEPDFAGAEITGISLELDSVSIQSPGDDPNGDGLWTYAFIEGRIVVMGRP